MTQYIWGFILALVGCSGIWSLVLYKITRRDARRDEKNAHDDAVQEALKGLLHQEIIRQGKVYRDKGTITKEELDDFRMYLYLPYKKLNGNGVADVVMDELIDLSKGGIAV